MKRYNKQVEKGFSLVEILVVIAVVGIMLTMAISYVAGTTRHAKLAVARQQQAELQTALGKWVVAKSSGTGGLAAARALYSGTSGPKIQLLQSYLQAATYASLSSSGSTVTSSALDSANAYLQFSDWPSAGQPTVQWVNR